MDMVFPLTVAARMLIILVKGGVEVATSPWVLQHIVDVSRCDDLLHDNLNYTKWPGGSINLSLIEPNFFRFVPTLNLMQLFYCTLRKQWCPT